MLSSFKKWVQDVTVDLTPPAVTGPSPSTSFFSSTSIIPGATHNNIYSTKPFGEHRESRDSTSSAVYLSRPISMESVRGSRSGLMTMPPPSSSPVELDLSHLNREEQEHIANVLRRARAVEEQQSNLLPVTVASIMSPAASVTSSLSTSSSSSSSSSSTSSTASFVNQQIQKNHNEIRQDESEKPITMPESTLTNIYQCQTCSREHRENSDTCFQCQEKEFINRQTDNNITFSTSQLVPIKKSLSPKSIAYDNHTDDDKIHDTISIIDSTQSVKQNFSMSETRPNQTHSYIENRTQDNKLNNSDSLRTNNLTEIDENEFFYEEPSPYVAVIKSNKNDEPVVSSYTIDEFIEEDNSDERDHVKELEETIANLSRHFPSEQIEKISSLNLPLTHIDTTTILEMEIESPSVEEVAFNAPTFTQNYSVSVPVPINNRRINISRSSGIRENLTDLLITSSSRSHQPLQRTLSTHSKHMLSINRPKRNLPSVPANTTSNQLQLRRANSESRFSLPAVSLPPILTLQQNLDDESDLLEIDLNDPVGSMNRTLNSKYELQYHNTNGKCQYSSNLSTNQQSSKTKQLRDQTTNTPPISALNSLRKAKKKPKQKVPSSPNHINDQVNITPSPSVRKLQKSTSTEITYPFPVTKLILNPPRHGISADFGFRITGGHSIPNCMEVTACIENIDIRHRNYEILKNIVEEGDEVLELGGVSLRGKSALFVENLMNTIQNEFEIIVRSRTTPITLDSLPIVDNNVSRRHSVDASQLPLNEPTNTSSVTKSKSTSISSLHQTSKITIDNDRKKQDLPSIARSTSNEKPTNGSTNHSRPSLLPNDATLNSTTSNISIDQANSNESDESDSLSQYFHSPVKQRSTSAPKGNVSIAQGRSQSVIPVGSDLTNASHRLQHFLKSDLKQSSKDSTSSDRKPSIALASLQFLKKKTQSADFSHQKKAIMNQLREHQYAGEIELQIKHDSERELLAVLIIRARNLLPKDANGFSDPFVKVYLLPGRDAENKRRIKHVAKTLNPLWNHTVVYGNVHHEELQNKKLEFTVWDYDRFKSNDFLGQVTIDLKNPNVIDDKPHWYRLQALRSREEMANRGSSPRLNNLTSGDSTNSSTTTINKVTVNTPTRTSQQK